VTITFESVRFTQGLLFF